jgi:hypothetical protein
MIPADAFHFLNNKWCGRWDWEKKNLACQKYSAVSLVMSDGILRPVIKNKIAQMRMGD